MAEHKPPTGWDSEARALADRPPVSGEPHRDYADRTCSTGLMHDHDRPPSGEPRTECEHERVASVWNWIPDGKGGTKRDGRAVYCRDCDVTFRPIEAEASTGADAPPDPWHPEGDCLAPTACGVTGFYCSNWRSAVIAATPRADTPPPLDGTWLRQRLTVLLIEAEADDQIGAEYTPDGLADYLAARLRAEQEGEES